MGTFPITSRWIHSDAYTDCDPLTTSHHCLNSSWDFANETIHATHLRKCARDSSHNNIADSEGDTHSTSHVLAQRTIEPPLEQNGHSGPLAVSTPAPLYEGAVSLEFLLDDNHIHSAKLAG